MSQVHDWMKLGSIQTDYRQKIEAGIKQANGKQTVQDQNNNDHNTKTPKNTQEPYGVLSRSTEEKFKKVPFFYPGLLNLVFCFVTLKHSSKYKSMKNI